LLNLRNLLNAIQKMHELCKTKHHETGYKDMNLFAGHILRMIKPGNLGSV